MLSKKLTSQVFANLMIQDETEKTTDRFYCPMHVLQPFFSSAELADTYMKDHIAQMSSDKITATLLQQENLEFEVCLENKTISCMKKC